MTQLMKHIVLQRFLEEIHHQKKHATTTFLSYKNLTTKNISLVYQNSEKMKLFPLHEQKKQDTHLLLFLKALISWRSFGHRGQSP